MTETGFSFQLDEWDYLDGRHTVETISWIAGTAGTHGLPDGTRVHFGSTALDGNGAATHVAAGSETQQDLIFGSLSGNSTTAVTHRIDASDGDGFDVHLQLEEAAGGTATSGPMTLSWVELTPAAGSAFTHGILTADHGMVTTGASLSEGRAFFADMATLTERDTATVRHQVLFDGTVGVRIAEDGSADTETWHAPETLGFAIFDTGSLVLMPVPGAGDVSDGTAPEAPANGDETAASEPEHMEVGTIAAAQRDSGTWHRVDFTQAIHDPVVVMGPASTDGAQPLTIRIAGVNATGFSFQIDEWDYLDGGHAPVDLSWMSGSAGTHTTAGGTTVTFGRSDLTLPGEAATIGLSEFAEAPHVFGQLATGTAGATNPALIHRIDDVTADGFTVRSMLEEAAMRAGNLSAGSLADVTDAFHFVAIDPGADAFLQTGHSVVDDVLIDTGASLVANDAYFADLATINDDDMASLRYAAGPDGTVQLLLQEEASFDAETIHAVETVSWLVIESGIHAFLV